MTVWILSTCAIVAALMLLRLILKGRMDPRLTYALWLLAALRILIPGSLFRSPASVEALAERTGVTGRIEEARYAPERATMYAPGTYDPADEELMLRSFTQTATAQGAWGGRDIAGMRVVDVREPSGAASSSQVEVEIVRDRSFPLRLAWYAGAALMGVWFLAINLRFSHRLRRERVPFQGELPVPCGLKVYLVEDLPSPCLAGLFRPAVYLNRAAVASGHLDHILTHELTHYRHGDQWWALLRCVCIAVQWFDPLVWIAAHLSRQDCESACDTSAIKALGEGERISYGRTLVDMIAVGHAPSAVFSTATTMTGGVKSIYRRISLIAQKPKMTALTLAAVLLTAALAVGCAFGGAGESVGVEDPAPEGTGAVQPSESVTPDTDALARQVRAVYDAIAGEHEGRNFTVDLDGKEGAVPLESSPETGAVSTEGTRYHITRDNDSNVESRSQGLSSFYWTAADPDEAPAGAALTLCSAGRETWLRCWSDSGLVMLRRNGEDIWLHAAPPSAPGDHEKDSVYAWLLPIMEEAVFNEVWYAPIDILPAVDEDILAYAGRVAERLLALPDWHRDKPLDCVVDPDACRAIELYAGPEHNGCFFVGFYLKLDDPNTPAWTAGAGAVPVTEGEYAGWWRWSAGVTAFPGDGENPPPPKCVRLWYGSGSVSYPTPLEMATMEELASYIYFTNPGPSKNYLVPKAILSRFGDRMDEFGGVLDGIPTTDGWEARQICRVLGQFLAEHWEDGLPSYEDIYSGLASKYRPYLKEGYETRPFDYEL